MGLHDADSVVIVYDEARKAVALAVDQTVAIGGLGIGQTGGDTHAEGAPDHIPPEVGRKDILSCEAQHADSDRAYLIVSMGQKITALREHPHDVTLHRGADNLCDGTGEHPRMESQKRVLSTFL